MEIENNKDVENANVIVASKNGELSQKWEIVYANELIIEVKQGELNKEYGLIVEKEFSIVSSMPSGRRVDIENGDLVLRERTD